MAVSFVANYQDRGSTSENVTLNAGGTNRLLIGMVSSSIGSPHTFTDITIDSVSVAGLTSNSADGGPSINHGYGYILDANHPGAGTKNMTYTSSGTASEQVYSTIELQGVDQTVPFGNTALTTATDQADGATISTTLNNSQGKFALVFVVTSDLNNSELNNHGLPSAATLIEETTYLKTKIRVGYIPIVLSNSEQMDFTVSANGSDNVDSIIVGAIAINADGEADTTPPVFSVAPNVTATTSAGHTISQTPDESCIIYGVRLANGATAPTSAQVKNGTDASDTAALEARLTSGLTSVSADLVFNTGSPSTDYDYYIVAEDIEAIPNLQAAPALVEAQTSALTPDIISVSADDIINNLESPIPVVWTVGANATSGQTPTLNSVNQGSYAVQDDTNSSFELVWPNAIYGATIPLVIGVYSQNVSLAPQTGNTYVTLASYVEGNADITASPSLVDGNQLEYNSLDTNGNAVVVDATGLVTITLAPGQTEPGSFDVRVIDHTDGARGAWQTIAPTQENLGPSISGSTAINIQDGGSVSTEYTILNMDGETPTLTGTDAANFTLTNIEPNRWRLASIGTLSTGTYNVTLNADDTVNPLVTLPIIVTVAAIVVKGIRLSTLPDLNPVVNSQLHPNNPGVTRANETFRFDLIENEGVERRVVASINVATDSSGNFPDIVAIDEQVFDTVLGREYDVYVSAENDGLPLFTRTIEDVS